MQFTFVVLVEILPGDGGLIVDQTGAKLGIDADGTLRRDGSAIGVVSIVRVIEPEKVLGIYARGKSDGKVWRWNGTAWAQVNLTTFAIPAFLPSPPAQPVAL